MKNSAIATTVLVTGGTGYWGLQCILQLLQEGYTVRATIRSLAKKDEIINSLKAGGITISRISPMPSRNSLECRRWR